MQIVIDIPQGLKIDFENENWTAFTCAEMKNALMRGTPLPKGHGRLIDEEEILKPFKKLGENKLTYWKTDYDGLITILNKTPSVLEAENEVSE